MTKLNANFAYCIKKFGPPAGGEPVPAEAREAYRDRVPQSLLDFWEEYGAGLWLDGRFQLVRPDRYQGLVDMILKGDPDFPAESSALIGYTAFGELLVWNNKNYFLRIDLVSKTAYTRHVSPKCWVLPPERALPSNLSRVDSEAYDFSEYGTARPLFDPALKKCGRLSYGECYGFFPAIGLGGLGMLDEVRKVRAAEHFAIIAQLEPIELRYMDTENRKVVALRHLGAN